MTMMGRFTGYGKDLDTDYRSPSSTAQESKKCCLAAAQTAQVGLGCIG